ncbi:DUF6600 domain-containing protein, partial [Mucilaginibacter sp. OK098]|uniref:DUF6600 domain-containing protein n=1 Tax=Mucilaginibacter sp. OK098 TaxID=1855297 RepID=UPI00091C7360
MKILNKIWGAGLLAILLLLAAPKQSKAQGGEYISDQEFYDDLEPDGTWVSDPRYGNVWIPNAEEGFRPYATRGHWVMTDYGNTWVSDYRWGWATFHYGRWRYDDYYGWEWIPGHEWAPAWVNWRHGGGYYGWAPLMPGISISISIGGGYRAPDNYWVCAPQRYINRPNIYNYYVPQQRAVTIIHNTTIINNTYINNNTTYIAGPRVQDIRRVTNQNVQVYKINNVNSPSNVRIQNNTVNIYRPAVNKAPDARPSRVVDGNAYRQQNPNQAIARRSTGGSAAFNHTNADRLAQVARNPKPDNKIVRVNPVNARPAQAANRPAPAQEGNKPGQPVNKPNPAQRDNRQTQPANGQRPASGVQPQQQATQRGAQQAQQKQQQAAQQAQQKQQQATQRGEQQAQQKQQQATQQAAQQAQQRQQQATQRGAQQAQQKQ